jgi:hypothetical protein
MIRSHRLAVAAALAAAACHHGREGGSPRGNVTPAVERCNGVDDDGDRRVDEGCPIRLTRDPDDDVLPEVAGGR